MNSNTELFFKIITTTGTFLLAYHKYILSLFDKKLDKRDCEKERLYAEKFRIENIKTLTEGIKRIEERMTRIEKELMKQYKN
ncbi:hypothetical protein [Fusobacterium varium]|uniref:hypothetical protein n=1 Tax=Fusobacterium varium TaxID=856 RepID=UPI0035617176